MYNTNILRQILVNIALKCTHKVKHFLQATFATENLRNVKHLRKASLLKILCHANRSFENRMWILNEKMYTNHIWKFHVLIMKKNYTLRWFSYRLYIVYTKVKVIANSLNLNCNHYYNNYVYIVLFLCEYLVQI